MNEALKFLDSLGLHTVKPGLGRITRLLEYFGDPHKRVRAIIVGGTNGKGSVASAVSAVLSAEGYLTGLYTSPHLVSVTERIKINGHDISGGDLSRIVLAVRDAAIKTSSETPSYFETLTAAAFVYFAERGADFSVLEVGMGGRWDATNVVSPLVSVITNISKDHTEYLGNTLAAIAAEKACIIKRGAPVVTAASGTALRVITGSARELSSKAYVYGGDFKSEGRGTENFRYEGPEWTLDGLRSNLTGAYQMENLSVAIAALESLSTDSGIKIREESVRNGISRINWPGRLEVLRESPPLILDCAHNPGGARALARSLGEIYPGTRFTFLIGMLKDKRGHAFLKELSPLAERVIFTEPPSERCASAETLSAAAAGALDCETNIVKDYKEAYNELLNLGSPACITGSIYLAGAIMELRSHS